ncbi:MAG: inositol monophosphatase family protein [Acidimicrobiales bacterium]
MAIDFARVLDGQIAPAELALLQVCELALDAAYDAATAATNWSMAAGHVGQHVGDVDADEAALRILSDSGLSILSEESGLSGPQTGVIAVIDPVDGSSNVARGIPYWCSSIGLVDEEGLLAGLVLAMPYRELFWSLRGRGAFRGTKTLEKGADRTLGESIVFLNGHVPTYLGWSQYRALGSAALELCMVAAGVADAFIDFSKRGLAVWDYLGAMAICQEAGCVLGDRDGGELLELSMSARRHVLAARTPMLFDEVAMAVARARGIPR